MSIITHIPPAHQTAGSCRLRCRGRFAPSPTWWRPGHHPRTGAPAAPTPQCMLPACVFKGGVCGNARIATSYNTPVWRHHDGGHSRRPPEQAPLVALQQAQWWWRWVPLLGGPLGCPPPARPRWVRPWAPVSMVMSSVSNTRFRV